MSIKSQINDIKKYINKGDIIDDVPEKSIEEIVEEVAKEEGMSEEEMLQALSELKKALLPNRATKPKKDKSKVKAKRKASRKSKQKNRK